MYKEAIYQQKQPLPLFIRLAGGLLLGATLVSCSASTPAEQASADSNYTQPGQYGSLCLHCPEAHTKQQTSYEKKREKLARELCTVLDGGFETTPWSTVLDIEGRYTTLNDKNSKPDDNLMYVAREYCPQTIDSHIRAAG